MVSIEFQYIVTFTVLRNRLRFQSKFVQNIERQFAQYVSTCDDIKL